jgi:hypothetical protein
VYVRVDVGAGCKANQVFTDVLVKPAQEPKNNVKEISRNKTVLFLLL